MPIKCLYKKKAFWDNFNIIEVQFIHKYMYQKFVIQEHTYTKVA